MPPTQSINPMASPLFGPSSSLDSGSLLQHHHHNDNDIGSWASALSSRAHSARNNEWIDVDMNAIDEATWQEEAHWMSFHHAIQSLVISFHRPPTRERSHSSNAKKKTNKDTPAQRASRRADSSSKASSSSRKSSSHNSGESSLVHAVTRQVMTETTAMDVPFDAILVTVEDANAQTRLALAQAEKDELEITRQAR